RVAPQLHGRARVAAGAPARLRIAHRARDRHRGAASGSGDRRAAPAHSGAIGPITRPVIGPGQPEAPPRHSERSHQEVEMGRVVVTEFVSVDGVIQAPGDPNEYERGGWATGGGQAGNQFKFDELMASDAQLLGRVTYEGFAKAWPSMEGTGVFGEKMNTMPKFVASTTLHDPEWENTSVLNG